MTAEVTVVVPTYNERSNIEPLHAALAEVLSDRDWEMIVVDDDSGDGTLDETVALARRDPRVRLLRRIGRRGLSSACIEGMLASTAPYLAVIDADGQHDEKCLPEMLDRLEKEQLDIVVASRYLPDGGTEGLSGMRSGLSRLATRLCRWLVDPGLSDPMSGFFAVRRSFFESVVYRLYGRGFKILLDLFASSSAPVRFREVSYHMRERRAGDSKLDVGVMAEYLLLLANKALGRLLPARFVLFCLVGLTGVVVHLSVLGLLFKGLGSNYSVAQAVATLVAMTSNFWLNNRFTFVDRRLRGAALLRGLISFYAICSLGVMVNVALATWAFGHGLVWWLAGLAGVAAAAVWNFSLSSALTWGARYGTGAVSRKTEN